MGAVGFRASVGVVRFTTSVLESACWLGVLEPPCLGRRVAGGNSGVQNLLVRIGASPLAFGGGLNSRKEETAR